MSIEPSILDYLGKYENGILVSIGLMYEDVFFNGIFYYTNNEMIINVDESLIKKMGCQIEDHPDYMELLKLIIKQVDPFETIADKLDEIKINSE